MSVSDVNAFFDLVGKAITGAATLHNSLYRSALDTANFENQVDSLRRKQAHWDRLLKRQGPRAQELVRDSLQSAIENLEREEARFNRRQANCWQRWSHKALTVENANLAIQNVFKAFEDIPQTLQVFDEADQILNRATSSDLGGLPFQSDKKYVPLQNTSAEVQRALEDPGGSSVVTLSGEPGSGKSTLAKYLALHYDELRTRKESNLFEDGVFFLACGPEATSKALHVELWQNFGFRVVFNTQSQQTDPSSVESIASDEHTYSESMLHKQLIVRLASSSVLIILDDVWHTKLLEQIILPGKGLKYLVTTQNRGLWGDAKQIHIARPSLGEARQILVNHVVGLPAGVKELPLNLQSVADAMIRTSEFNPLVLANLALTISSERATNVEEWITAKKYHLELLDDDERAPLGFGQTYPRTVAASMTMAVDSMAGEAKKLLFLAALCDGPSVPEIVLKVLFKGLHGSLARFQKSSNYLEDRAFIQIEIHDVDWTDVPERTWSVHRLRKHFVLEKTKDEVAALVAQLHSIRQSDADIVSALYFLFASKSWPDEGAAARLGISRERNDFNWTSIKPFVRLLHVDGDEDWKRKSYQIAKTIIVHYLSCGELHDSGLSKLLEMPEVQPATCWALGAIARLEQKTLLTEKHDATLKGLLGLLEEKVDPSIQSWGAVALGLLALESHKIIMAQPQALERLLGLLKGNLAVNNDVKLNAAWALGNLASTFDSKNIIVSYPGILEALVLLLDRNAVQTEAAYTLRRLAYSESTDLEFKHTKLIALPGMLEKLVHMLDRGVDPEVQKEVVWLLGNLAVSYEDKIRIRSQPGVLQGLVGILSKEAGFDTQRYHAVYALRRLTLKTGDSELLGIPSALEKLMALLVDDLRPDEQQEAAHCLSFLTYPLEYRIGLARTTGLVKGLVGLLREQVSPITQLIAIGTLANLAEADENKILVAAEPGVIHSLVSLLANYSYPHHERQSELAVVELTVRCLGQLATANYKILLTLSAFPGALQGLVKLLGNTQTTNSWVRQTAAWIFNNLAETEELRLMMGSFPDSVLTELLLGSPDLGVDIQDAEFSRTLQLNSARGERPQLKAREVFGSKAATVHEDQPTTVHEDQPNAFQNLQANPQTTTPEITTAVNFMTKEAKSLLFLAAICDGPSVPEVVLKVLFNCLHGSLANFQECSKFLEANAFVQIETQRIKWADWTLRNWSVHGLGQLFMLEKRRDEVSAMLSRLHSMAHEDADIVAVLYFFFIAKSWTDESVKQMVSVSSDVDVYNQSSIKPFVWLLQPEGDEEWKRKSHGIVKKIIVGYVSHGNLNDSGLSTLLGMFQVQSAACWALEALALLEQRPLLNETHEEILKSLLRLLGDAFHRDVQRWATVALGALALQNHQIILAQPSALEQLLRMLQGKLEEDYIAQQNGAWTLANLAATLDSKRIIARYPGMLEALMTLLQADEYPDVQREAVYALRRLAYGEHMNAEVLSEQTRMIEIPGMVKKLVFLLGNSVDPEILNEVVGLLGNLAVSHEDKMLIREHPGALHALVSMLAMEDCITTRVWCHSRSINLRYRVLYALRSLTLTTGDAELLRTPGAVARLVALLEINLRPDEQREAANCLSSLAYPLETRVELAAIPGVVKGLVGLLQEHVSPSTQLVAAQTLADLAEVDENRWLVALESDAIEHLVRLLVMNGDLDPLMQSALVEVAVRCLGQLTFENHDNQLKIAAFPGAVEGLLELLDHPEISGTWVQQVSTWALSNLAAAESNRSLITAFPSAVPKLTQLATDSTDPDVQWYAESALKLLKNSRAMDPNEVLQLDMRSNGIADDGNFRARKRLRGLKSLALVPKAFSRGCGPFQRWRLNKQRNVLMEVVDI